MNMKKCICFAVLIVCLLCACARQDVSLKEKSTGFTEERANVKKQWKKGYDLPIDEKERREAEDACKLILRLVSDIYAQADKGEGLDIILDDKAISKIQHRIKKKGYPIRKIEPYSTMENYEEVEDFLEKCQRKKAGSVVFYELNSDGTLSREKFIFDGKDMYLLNAAATWNGRDNYGVSYLSYARVKEWNYAKKAWFGYELCVPEPPEVTEVVDGSCLIRIKPLTKEREEMSQKYVRCLGYQGNNLLCSNWDENHMEKLDYNGIYEYLYAMKYQKKLEAEDVSEGIPKEEFESLIMEYLPVTAKQLRKYAAFDKEKQSYAWISLGCASYVPTFFGTSIPEVVDVKNNADGTLTLRVDAICDMVVCEDRFISHELRIRPAKNGSFQYLGNKILNDGIKQLPDYQYRIKNTK